MNKVILLNNRPVGKPALSDFKFVEESKPVAKDGELLIKTLFVSVDPYLRGRMNNTKSYIPPFEIGKPLQSGIIAQVEESFITDFKKGDFVAGNLAWKEYQLSDGKGLNRLDASVKNLSLYLGVLGITGLTAYLGIAEIGIPKPGETMVVSGAAGAVGNVVGQIGKIIGCHVVGITGSEKKVDMLTSTCKFDAAINYTTSADLKLAIKNACPAGVDVYFDNVGGDISDAVLANINTHARIVLCGAIALYNETKVPIGPRLQPLLITKSALMQGFIINDFADKFPEAIEQLTDWVNEGKLVSTETIIEGFDAIPQAFLDLFEGKNEGKMIVKI